MNVNFKSLFLVFEKINIWRRGFVILNHAAIKLLLYFRFFHLMLNILFCNKSQTSSKTSFDKQQQQKQPQKVQSSMKILRIHILHT